MRLPISLPAISWLFLLAFAITTAGASAQDIFVTPIPNAPFSGVVNMERSRVQRDGSVVTFKTIRDIGRDSRGRIHNERRDFLPVSDTRTPQIVRIHLYDPQTRISTWLNPQERTFWTETLSHPPSTVPPAFRLWLADWRRSPSKRVRERRGLGRSRDGGIIRAWGS
jgi:hypothetical protein